VPVAIELGRSEVSVRELLELRAGDLLRLDTRFDEEIQVRVAGRLKFRARPGRRGRNRAVRITGSTGGPIDVGGKRQDAAK
jgi:flagellar motor switch protein FliM